jgi:hypothetical protein
MAENRPPASTKTSFLPDFKNKTTSVALRSHILFTSSPHSNYEAPFLHTATVTARHKAVADALSLSVV